MDIRRISSEFENAIKKYDIEMVDDSISSWNVAFPGPENTPYYGYTFLLEVHIPKDYPLSSPKVAFQTIIYHPNITKNGEICMGPFSSWKPKNTIKELLEYISSILINPDPSNPLEPQIAIQYVNDKPSFEKQAIDVCKKYAVRSI